MTTRSPRTQIHQNERHIAPPYDRPRERRDSRGRDGMREWSILGVAGLTPWTYLIDLDGVLMHGEEQMVPGADQFLAALREHDIPFVVFTNKSIHTPRNLRALLRKAGLDVPESAIWTSALATAQFLDKQYPCGSAHVIGESGLITALDDIGYVLTDRDPDYVILGETHEYSFRAISQAIRLIERGARFIATNPDEKATSPHGTLPATGAVAALIERVTDHAPYYVGKPNPLMIRSVLRAWVLHSEDMLIIGDRMDTDIRSGLESGLHTILVLSGISSAQTVAMFPYQPTKIIGSVAELIDRVDDPFRA